MINHPPRARRAAPSYTFNTPKPASNISAASCSSTATPKAPPPDTRVLTTTFLATQKTSSTSNASECGGPEKKEAEQITVDMWPLPTEIRSWKMSFKSEVSHTSQYPKAVMLRIAEIEDAKSMKKLETSASSTSKRKPDFENLLTSRSRADPGEF